MRAFRLGGLFIGLCGGLGLARAETHGGAQAQVPAETDPLTEILPAEKIGAPTWVDHSHQWASSNLHQQVERFDSLFKPDGTVVSRKARSRFRIGTYLIADPRRPQSSMDTDLNFSGHVNLPQLRDRFRVVLDSSDLEALPGQYPDERDDKVNLALRRAGKWLEADVGVKLKSSPVAYAKLSRGFSWATGMAQWNFGQKFFFQNDTRFGEVSTLTQHAWLGPNALVGHTTAGRWTEVSDGLEWEDAVSLTHVRQLMEEKDRRKFVGNRNIARGAGLRLSVNGHHNGGMVTDRYRAATFWRRPVGKKNWCFFEIAPEVEWRKEEDWEAVYVVRAGFDIWFRNE